MSCEQCTSLVFHWVFTIILRCVGVFDTVGSLGLPEELTLRSSKMKTLFGFPDRLLGEHIERAYQALALDEHRADFVRLSLQYPGRILTL